MAHNHGNRAPGRPRTDRRKSRNNQLITAKKERVIKTWNRHRDAWKNNKVYQDKQDKRKAALRIKVGGTGNLERGVKESLQAKKYKQERKEALKQQKQRGWKKR